MTRMSTRYAAAVVAVALLTAVGASSSAAQTRETAPLSRRRPQWNVIVRIVPNPMVVGSCAAVRVEVQDDEGYVSSQLRDGSAADSRRFRYESSERESFHWQDDKPATGYLCADKDARPGTTQVMVTLPDGLSGSVEVTSIPVGKQATPVSYPPQGRIRHAGYQRAPLAPIDIASSSAPTSTSTTSSTSTSTSTSSASTPTYAPFGIHVGAPLLEFSGTNFVSPSIHVTAPTLSFAGTNFPLTPSIHVTTEPLVLTMKFPAPAPPPAPPPAP